MSRACRSPALVASWIGVSLQAFAVLPVSGAGTAHTGSIRAPSSSKVSPSAPSPAASKARAGTANSPGSAASSTSGKGSSEAKPSSSAAAEYPQPNAGEVERDRWIHAGDRAAELGHFDEARNAYIEANRARPNDPTALARLAGAEMRLENPRQAISLYTRALALKPGYYEFRLGLARAYAADGRFDAAIEEYEGILKEQASSTRRSRITRSC